MQKRKIVSLDVSEDFMDQIVKLTAIQIAVTKTVTEIQEPVFSVLMDSMELPAH